MTNFKLGEPQFAIHLISRDRLWDLHNTFDFAGLTFRSGEGSISLRWIPLDGFGLKRSLRLIFSGVTRLSITESDIELPQSEDMCLAYVTFLAVSGTDCDEHKNARMSRVSRKRHDTLLFKFQSGRSIEIEAAQVRLVTQQVT